MIEIITEKSFNTLPWKNGKGETIELAINQHGTLENFDWRLSMATVSENGVFSDFSGYERNLVLIEGNSIHLSHNNKHTDQLDQLLDVATFDGGNITHGFLPAGTIKDFNIITATDKYTTRVETYLNNVEKAIKNHELVFAYSLTSNIEVSGKLSTLVQQGDLLKLESPTDLRIKSADLILIYLNSK